MLRPFLALLLFAAFGTCCASDEISIDRVEAKLFYSHTGTLSPPIAPTFALWNVIIGEGGASEPSDATLIDVVLKGTPGSYAPDASVDLVVSNAESGRVISRQSASVGVLSSAGEFHVAFWLAGTGCEPLAIEASLHGAKAATRIEVPFACGE